MSNSTGTARNDLVQILPHANGTFDVLYNVPEHYESGWGNLAMAVLTGVCTHIANQDGIAEDACHYRDASDLVRARKFMDEAVVRFPMLCLAADLSENFSTRSIKSGVLDLSLLEDLVIVDFSMAIQSILLSGSVLTNPVENSRGLVTVTAKFGEEVFKVRLTGFIPKTIAEVLRKPYEYVTRVASEGFQRVERGNVKAARTSLGLTQKQIQTEVDVLVGDVAGLIGVLNNIQKRLSDVNSALQKDTDPVLKKPDDGRQSLKRAQEVETHRRQKNQEQRKKVTREYQNSQAVQQRREEIAAMSPQEQRQELKKDLENLRGLAVSAQEAITRVSQEQQVPNSEQEFGNSLRLGLLEQEQYEFQAGNDTPSDFQLVVLDTNASNTRNSTHPAELGTAPTVLEIDEEGNTYQKHQRHRSPAVKSDFAAKLAAAINQPTV